MRFMAKYPETLSHMKTRILRDKDIIYSFLSGNPGLHLYTIGDLDDFFWPNTTWFGWHENNEIKSIAMLYKGMDPHTLLLFHEGDLRYPEELLKSILPHLPREFNVHLSPGLIEIFGKNNIIIDWGRNYRMILTREPGNVADDNIRSLNISDIDQINELFMMAYPSNWFDKRMLDTGKYKGYFIENKLAGIAGIHVYSPEYRIAALGNIATHPEFRGRKIAYKLTSALCTDLKKTTDFIGLNVSSENKAAIKCYENTGFEIRSSYDECYVRNPAQSVHPASDSYIDRDP
jgi:ribosomal protein S18 acetylase RimI-like enzyme